MPSISQSHDQLVQPLTRYVITKNSVERSVLNHESIRPLICGFIRAGSRLGTGFDRAALEQLTPLRETRAGRWPLPRDQGYFFTGPRYGSSHDKTSRIRSVRNRITSCQDRKKQRERRGFWQRDWTLRCRDRQLDLTKRILSAHRCGKCAWAPISCSVTLALDEIVENTRG